MNIEQNMWSCDLPASPDKFDLLHWYHCWYTVNNPWQIENCMYYIHTLKEIDNSGITVTLDSISNSQDCFGIPFIHEFVWSKITSKLWQSTIIAILTLVKALLMMLVISVHHKAGLLNGTLGWSAQKSVPPSHPSCSWNARKCTNPSLCDVHFLEQNHFKDGCPRVIYDLQLVSQQPSLPFCPSSTSNIQRLDG